jgi:phage terminase large subunit GpA-like protein
MLTAAADVQMNGIYVEVVAWAPNRESWVVYTDVLEGDTTDANGGAFLKLAELYDREWPDAYGGKRRKVDGFRRRLRLSLACRLSLVRVAP